MAAITGWISGRWTVANTLIRFVAARRPQAQVIDSQLVPLGLLFLAAFVLEGRYALPARGANVLGLVLLVAAGVWIRVLQRVLALTAAIWHNDRIGAPVARCLTAYDH